MLCAVFSGCLSTLESDDEYFDAEGGASQVPRGAPGSEPRKAAEVPNEALVNLLLKFEVKEVCVLFVYECILVIIKLFHGRPHIRLGKCTPTHHVKTMKVFFFFFFKIGMTCGLIYFGRAQSF